MWIELKKYMDVSALRKTSIDAAIALLQNDSDARPHPARLAMWTRGMKAFNTANGHFTVAGGCSVPLAIWRKGGLHPCDFAPALLLML